MSGTQTEKKAPKEGAFPLFNLRHSTAHLMASAVARLIPGARFANGPPIEDGFYYDFDLPRPLTDEDLPKIEAEMRKILGEGGQFLCDTVTREEAASRLKDQPFKLETLSSIPADEKITFYRHGNWMDLCEGPHLDELRRIPPDAFKLLSIAGAYWHGDEKRPMLQRVYGTVWWNKQDLEAYLKKLEEIEKRDHRRLGVDLELFSVHPEVGAGFIFWHPNLGIVRRTIEEFLWAQLQRRGYLPVYTPHVSSEKLFQRSGHLQNYGDLMYSPMDIDGFPYRVKPMNCPGHIEIFKSTVRSYRDLPLRYAELGTVYRYEKSGVLHGMLRVRGFTQDDSHIFCTPDQLESELVGVLDLVQLIVKTFGYDYRAYLATRPKENSIGTEEFWQHATNALAQAAKKKDINLETDEGGGAFYGPKIDFKLKDALGREWQGPTVQVDYNLPERFDIHYIDRDNTQKRPVMVHRAVLGSFERFVGGLIEHYGGKFPFWLAPTQIALIPIKDDALEFAKKLEEQLLGEMFRVKLLPPDQNLNKRIKHAQHEQVPYMAVIGAREAAANSIALRLRSGEDKGAVPVEEFLKLCREKRTNRDGEL